MRLLSGGTEHREHNTPEKGKIGWHIIITEELPSCVVFCCVHVCNKVTSYNRERNSINKMRQQIS